MTLRTKHIRAPCIKVLFGYKSNLISSSIFLQSTGKTYRVVLIRYIDAYAANVRLSNDI